MSESKSSTLHYPMPEAAPPEGGVDMEVKEQESKITTTTTTGGKRSPSPPVTERSARTNGERESPRALSPRTLSPRGTNGESPITNGNGNGKSSSNTRTMQRPISPEKPVSGRAFRRPRKASGPLHPVATKMTEKKLTRSQKRFKRIQQEAEEARAAGIAKTKREKKAAQERIDEIRRRERENIRADEEAIEQARKKDKEMLLVKAEEMRQRAREAQWKSTAIHRMSKNAHEDLKRAQWLEGRIRAEEALRKARQQEMALRDKVRAGQVEYQLMRKQQAKEALEKKWAHTGLTQASIFQDELEHKTRRHKEIRETNRLRVLERRRRLVNSCPFLAPTPPEQRVRPKKLRAQKKEAKTARLSTNTTEDQEEPEEEETTEQLVENLFTVLCKQAENAFTTVWPDSRPPKNTAGEKVMGFNDLLFGYLTKVTESQAMMKALMDGEENERPTSKAQNVRSPKK